MVFLKECFIHTGVYVVLLLLVSSDFSANATEKQWADPFDQMRGTALSVPDSITFEMALDLVGQANISLQAGQEKKRAAAQLVDQARRRPNPELEFEVEEVGGHLRGFRQSEFTIGLSQEFELWGKRKARTEAARRDQDAVDLESRMVAFDIYAETKLRFAELLHVQQKLYLAKRALELADDMKQSTNHLVENGKALPSEYLLSELAYEQAGLNLANMETEVANARRNLAALWMATGGEYIAVEEGKVPADFPDIATLLKYVPESREIVWYNLEEARFQARLSMEKAAARPGLTLSGGLKRLEGEKQNSFVFGVAMPLPLFDRNQGNIGALRSDIQTIRLSKKQALAKAEAELQSMYRRLTRLRNTYASIDTLLIPKAEETYDALSHAYNLGRIPYVSLVEGEGRMIELHFEKNDLKLAIMTEISGIEQLLGITFDSPFGQEMRN